MKLTLLFAGLLGSASALAQTVTSVTPARNAPAAPRTTAVAVTLSAPVPPSTASALKVFSAQSGGKKSGVATVAGSTISFVPTSPFKPGETVTATLTTGASVPQVWQFTAAATGGSGTFTPGNTEPFNLSSNPAYPVLSPTYRTMCLADVNNDGYLDLVTFCLDVQVHLNDGRGTFTAIAAVPVPQGFGGVWDFRCSMQMADIDSDGDLDILVNSTTNQVHTLVNNGRGNFWLGLPTLVGGSGWGITSGDIDGDGDIDFIANGRGSSSHIFYSSARIGINDGSGTFTTRNFTNSADNDVVTDLRDLNGDGALDAVSYDSQSNVGYYRFNDGNGNFGVRQQSSGNVFADVDADGDLDIAKLTSSGLQVLLNSAGSFTTSPAVMPAIGARTWQMNFSDADGDGRPDLLMLTGNGQQSPDSVKVLRNLGNGAFARPITSALPSNGSNSMMSLGDVDGDGDVDFVSLTSNAVRVMLNGAAGVLGTASSVANKFIMWPNPVSAASALHVTLAAPVTRGTLRLATVLGQQVRTHAFAGSSTEVATTGLAAGVYLLTVEANGQAPLTKRIVIE